MRLSIVTIALDAIRFLPTQFAIFNRLTCDWHWYVAECVARNVKDTSWCKPMLPRLSCDGTTEFLKAIAVHPRVTIFQQPIWDGKTAMINTLLAAIKEPGVLLEVDADEIWMPYQVEDIVTLFEQHDPLQSLRFFCRYFLGPNLITVGENCYGANPGEWLRAWRFFPGQTFATHEPPKLDGCDDSSPERSMTRTETRDYGLVFDHYAYAYVEQLRFKEAFYGYKNAVALWTALQRYKGPFPVKLKRFLHWVDDWVEVVPLEKEKS